MIAKSTQVGASFRPVALKLTFAGVMVNVIELTSSLSSRESSSLYVVPVFPSNSTDSDNNNPETDDLLSMEKNEDNSEDDDLEIPAFLRRQKN